MADAAQPRLLHRRIGATASVLLIAAATLALGGGPAYAAHVIVPREAPLWMHLGAGAVLTLHIAGGAVGLLSGAIALLARKGGPLHRAAGNVFFVAMLTMSGIGAVVAPVFPDRISSVAGFMTFYFIFTGWRSARNRAGVGPLDIAGFVYALAGAAAAITLSWMAAQTPEGTLDGAPKQAFYIFVSVSTLAALCDLKLILRRGISGAQRIARHVWRMCFGLFVASGSLFLGQAQVFPDWLRHTPALPILALAPLPFLVFWMLRVRLSKRYRPAPVAA